MPVVAVVAGAATAASGAAAFAAAGGFAAGLTAATIASGLAVVGGVATALGAVTGNKKLMRVGMVAGVAGLAVGGISSLMSTGAETSTALSVGDSGLGLSAKAAGEGLQISDTGLSGIGNKAAEAAGGSFGSGLGESLKNVNAIDTGVPSMVVGSGSAQAASVAAPAVDYGIRAPSVLGVQQTSFAPSATNVMDDATSALRAPSLPGMGDTEAGVFSGVSRFVNKNPELVKLGAGMLSGVGQGYMAQQQQRDADRVAAEQRARINTSITGQRQRF